MGDIHSEKSVCVFSSVINNSISHLLSSSSLTGGYQLLHSEGPQVQPGHPNFPPVAGRQTGLWPQFRQQGRGHHLLQRNALCPQRSQRSGWR